MAVAGLALGLATFVPWLESEVFLGDQLREGVRLTLGLAVVVLALLLFVLGIADARRAVTGRGFAIATLVLSLAALAVTAFVALAPETAIATFEAGRIATGFDLEAEPVRDIIEGAFDADTATARPAVGLYLALAASVLALGGSVLGIVAVGRVENEARRRGAPVDQTPEGPSPID